MHLSTFAYFSAATNQTKAQKDIEGLQKESNKKLSTLGHASNTLHNY